LLDSLLQEILLTLILLHLVVVADAMIEIQLTVCAVF